MAALIYIGAALFLVGGVAMTSAFVGDPTSTFWMRIVLGLLGALLGLTLFIVGSVLHRPSGA